jgi:hypothetical protein
MIRRFCRGLRRLFSRPRSVSVFQGGRVQSMLDTIPDFKIKPMSVRISVIMRSDHLPEEREDIGKYLIDAGMASNWEWLERQGQVVVRGNWYTRPIDVAVIFFVRALRANPVVAMVFLEID